MGGRQWVGEPSAWVQLPQAVLLGLWREPLSWATRGHWLSSSGGGAEGRSWQQQGALGREPQLRTWEMLTAL